MKLIQYTCACVCLTIAAAEQILPGVLNSAASGPAIGQVSLQPTSSQTSLRQGITPTNQVQSTFNTKSMAFSSGPAPLESNILQPQLSDDNNDAFKTIFPGVLSSTQQSSVFNPLLKYRAVKKVNNFDDKGFVSSFDLQRNIQNTNAFGTPGTSFLLGKSLNTDQLDDNKVGSAFAASQILQNLMPKTSLQQPLQSTTSTNQGLASSLSLSPNLLLNDDNNLRSSLFGDDNHLLQNFITSTNRGANSMNSNIFTKFTPKKTNANLGSNFALSASLNKGLFDDDNKFNSAFLASQILQNKASSIGKNPLSINTNTNFGLPATLNTGIFDDDNNKLRSSLVRSNLLQSVLPATSTRQTFKPQSAATTSLNKHTGTNFNLLPRISSLSFDDDNKLGSSLLAAKYLQSILPKVTASSTSQSARATTTNQQLGINPVNTPGFNTNLFNDDNDKFVPSLLTTRRLQSVLPKANSAPLTTLRASLRNTNNLLETNFALANSLNNNDDNNIRSSLLGNNRFDDDSNRNFARQNFVSSGIQRATGLVNQNPLTIRATSLRSRTLPVRNSILRHNIWNENDDNAFMTTRVVNSPPVRFALPYTGTVQQLPFNFRSLNFQQQDDNDFYPTQYVLPQFTSLPMSTRLHRTSNLNLQNTIPSTFSRFDLDDTDTFLRMSHNYLNALPFMTQTPTFRLSGKGKGKEKASLKEIKSSKPIITKSIVPKGVY